MTKQDTWYYLATGARPAAVNMALDEVLLKHISELGRPVLRFYGWSEPAATFGYFQKIEDVRKLTSLRPLVRRPTGGGLVPHDGDWTYSVVFPPSHEWYRLRAVESYRRLHEWVSAALAGCGVDTKLALDVQKSSRGQCFAGPDQSDIVHGSRKIAGAAQRRSRQGLLIQGSLQPEPGMHRGRWEEAMRKSRQWEMLDLPIAIENAARLLAAEKYGMDAYNQRR